MPYDHVAVETKWQKRWKDLAVFTSETKSELPKFYLFEYPPYPSGNLHVGHVRNYTIGDVLARFKRMRGFNVLYTQGFDSFGLPNEMAAIEQKTSPKQWSQACIKKIKNQFIGLGYSYDTNRFVTYHNEAYYKWTQWLFLLLLENGLAYKKKAGVNWCDRCETVLADDQVENSRCWRCDGPVRTKYMDQWFLAVQKYADKLLDGLESLRGWPSRIKTAQKNWFGRTEGVEIIFQVNELDADIPVFSTTPELIAGTTFIAVSPDHDLVLRLLAEGMVSDVEIAELDRAQSAPTRPTNKGVFLNLCATNPLTGDRCPIYAASYVHGRYGTGAIFGVPAHDKTDFKFALENNLPSKSVVAEACDTGKTTAPYCPTLTDTLVNTEQFAGLSLEAAREEMTQYFLKRGVGKRAVHFRVRDWLISRQRYWGAPIPVIYCGKCGVVPVPESDLPVRLPKKVDLRSPGNPLAHSDEFANCRCYKCGRPGRRETDTMDTFVNSSWFYLRYCSPKSEESMFSPEAVEYWMPADLAIGGIEHATTVYIHDRFITKVLFDNGLLSFDEPFHNLIAHELVVKDGKKMSKSIGNTVDPDKLIAAYGADALRLAILFAAPPDKKLEWKESLLKSCGRFLDNLWRLVNDNVEEIKFGLSEDLDPDKASPAYDDLAAFLDHVIAKVTFDLDHHRFNKCIHELMKMHKMLADWARAENHNSIRERAEFAGAVQTTIVMLAPFAPHISEELWETLGLEGLACRQPWPRPSIPATLETPRDLVVQINGSLETVIKDIVPETDRTTLESLVFSNAHMGPKLLNRQVTSKIWISRNDHLILNLSVSELAARPERENRRVRASQ